VLWWHGLTDPTTPQSVRELAREIEVLALDSKSDTSQTHSSPRILDG